MNISISKTQAHFQTTKALIGKINRRVNIVALAFMIPTLIIGIQQYSSASQRVIPEQVAGWIFDQAELDNQLTSDIRAASLTLGITATLLVLALWRNARKNLGKLLVTLGLVLAVVSSIIQMLLTPTA